MTATKFVSITAASRITKVPTELITRLEAWASVVLVVFVKGLGLRPRFISYKAFKADAAAFRLAGAAKLTGTVTELGADIYTVQGSKGDNYTVDFAVDSCSCLDHRNRGAHCKHLIKVGDYVASRKFAKEAASRQERKMLVAFTQEEWAEEMATRQVLLERRVNFALRAAIDAAAASNSRPRIGNPEYSQEKQIAFASCGF